VRSEGVLVDRLVTGWFSWSDRSDLYTLPAEVFRGGSAKHAGADDSDLSY
jgi:hypothetical protein